MGKKPFKKNMLTDFYKIHLLKTFLLLLLPSKFFLVIYCYIKKNIFFFNLKSIVRFYSFFIFRPSIFFQNYATCKAV